jgi:TolA-binding protein
MDTDRLWTIGASAFEDGLYDQAYRALGRFIALAPEDPRRGDAGVIRGKAALALGRNEDALAEFQGALGSKTQVIPVGEVVFWQAEALFRLNRFAEALTRYRRFLTDSPASPYAPDAWFGRGQCELHEEDSSAAIESFQALVTQYPQNRLVAGAAYSAALELVRAKRWDDALTLLETYGARYPTSPTVAESRYLLGVSLVEKGRTAEGIRALEGFLTVAPKHDLAPTARALLADTYAKTGRPRNAIAQYQLLLKAPGSPALAAQALYQVGELSRKLALVPDAEAAWQALRRDYPQDALAAEAGLALVELEQGRRQFVRATTLAREVAQRGGPRRVAALLLVGESAIAAGNLREAEQGYREALLDAPQGSAEGQRAAGGLLALGERHFKATRLEEAARVYGLVAERAVGGSDLQLRAVAGTGIVAEARGDMDEARRRYQEIVGSTTDRDLVRWAEARLKVLEPPAPPDAEKAGQAAESAGGATADGQPATPVHGATDSPGTPAEAPKTPATAKTGDGS